MKHTLLGCLFAFAASFSFGQGLPKAPVETIDMRLEMAGQELEKAGRSRMYGILTGVVCGTIYGLSLQDEKSRGLSTGMAIGACAGFTIFEIKGAIHQSKAGAHLRGQ